MSTDGDSGVGNKLKILAFVLRLSYDGFFVLFYAYWLIKSNAYLITKMALLLSSLNTLKRGRFSALIPNDLSFWSLKLFIFSSPNNTLPALIFLLKFNFYNNFAQMERVFVLNTF